VSVRIDRLIFGYVVFSVGKDGIAKAGTRLLRSGLTADIDGEGSFEVSLHSLKKYRAALFGMEHTESEVRGLPGALLKNRKRYGVLAALVLSFCFYLIFGGNIWDVRVSGNENIDEAAIRAELREYGLYPGCRVGKGGFEDIEIKVLGGSENIGWINVNRVGRVAYVVIKEKKVPDKSEEEPFGYSNIVASTDCIIEEITVKSGIAAVKVGDTVPSGSLLISGVLPDETGGGFVNAEGRVIGRATESITVNIPRKATVTEYGEQRLTELTVKIFDFSLNIFKRYRKIDYEYVIIEDAKECFAFGKYRLPLEIRRTYIREKTEKQVVYSDSELISMASRELLSKREASLAEKEVLRIKTSGGFTAEGYEMTSVVTALCDVGIERIFSEKGDGEQGWLKK